MVPTSRTGLQPSISGLGRDCRTLDNSRRVNKGEPNRKNVENLTLLCSFFWYVFFFFFFFLWGCGWSCKSRFFFSVLTINHQSPAQKYVFGEGYPELGVRVVIHGRQSEGQGLGSGF